jgi:hypothetical protein
MAKVKIPKRVAGVKVPKKVRKQAKKAIKAAESPVVREFAAAAIGAAAKAGTARAGRRVVRIDAGREIATDIRIDGERVVEAIRTAALDGIQRFLEGFEEGLRKATARPRDEDPDAGARRA